MTETKWCSCNPLRDAQEKAEKWDAIVRCKDCRYFDEDESCLRSYGGNFDPEGFCAWGELRRWR